MRRTLDNASIRLKLLIIPALAIAALGLLSVVTLRAYDTGRAVDVTIARLTQTRLRQLNDAKMLAAGLQAQMFRLITMGLIGVPAERLQPMAVEIQRRDLALGRAVAALSAGEADVPGRVALDQALDTYHTQSSHTVVNFLANFGWGATTARNAAVALDAVIEELARQQRAAEAGIIAAEADQAVLNDRQRTDMLWATAVGSPAMVLVSLLLGGRISGPIRRLTTVMVRLADRQFDDIIPALEQRDEVGSMARAVAVFRDALLHADALTRQQRATKVFLDTVLEHVPAPMIVKDAVDLSYVHINRAAEALLGLSRDQVLGRTIPEIMPPETATRAVARDRAALASGGTLVDEGTLIQSNGGGERLGTVTRVAIAGPDGNTQYLLTMVEDATERLRAEQRIAHLAHFDSLTGLPNRALFAERLAAAVGGASAVAQVAVLGLDLDHFKAVNDTLGHAAGDALLCAVTARLRECLRDGDTLARLGGDEFAVIQCGLRRPNDAEALAERLLQTVRQPFDIDGQQVFIGLSTGIALGTPGCPASELVKQADMALYEAKQAGRGGSRWFVPAMDARVRQRRALETELRAAIGTGQLTLAYQPQVDLDSSAILGVEALMRWASPLHGQVPPSAFIPLAEESGMIGPLGEWLLEEACNEAMGWSEQLPVAVNVSPVQLRLPGFLDAVSRALDMSGLHPGRLELEVTEGILLRDTDATLAILAKLRGMGVSLALDDFGTGYSSLSYLQKFRFDRLKIDRSFVGGLDLDPNAAAIVRAVVGLSEALGMRTLAEGVETAAEVAMLRSLACDEAQGYHFWQPMDAQAMRALAGEVRPMTSQSAQA